MRPTKPTKQLTRSLRSYVATTLLRCEPLQSAELARRLDDRPRTIERLLATLREAGEWCRAHGLPWWEVVTEVRGRERWHRIVDHEARRKP
jgi:hypothetical protein